MINAAIEFGVMRAIQAEEFGGPDVLKVVEIPTPIATDHQVLIEVTRAGINFADTHQRQNDYIAKATLPLVPGVEVAGVVVAGQGFEPGERVVALVGSGGYAQFAVAPVGLTYRIPDAITDETALALLLQGLSAWHIIRTAGHLASGETLVVHAAAGGVGSLAVQLGKPLGAGRVIATASTAEKRQLALELGADAAVDVQSDELTADLIAANNDNPVDVVLEMAGGKVFDASFDALAPFGRMVVYGIASREANTVRTGTLLGTSKAVVGFWFNHLLRNPEAIGLAVNDLFERAERGELRVVVGGVFPLSQAAQVHTDMQARRTTGKLLLDPSA